MKKNKLLSIISVISLSLILSSCSYGSNRITKLEDKILNSSKNINKDKKTEDSKSGQVNYSKIEENIKELKKLIDNVYLNVNDENPNFEVGIYKGLIESLKDPYSVYYSESEFKALNEDTSGEFGGIGVEVGVNEEGFLQVVAPIKNTPAEKAGLKSGDIITHINSKIVNTKKLNEEIKSMRGEPGSEVNITIRRGNEIKNFKMKREIISVESVHFKLLDNNIGYVLLTGFKEKSASEFEDAVEKLKKQGAKKLILDLRNNPGGLLDQTVKIADYLMDKATLISIRYKNNKKEVIETNDGKIDLPMVTLINEGSASASEVLSAALKDNKRSVLVGKKTFGKGIIQQIYPINNDGREEGLKLTIAEFYTPLGYQIHNKGIEPNYKVEISKDVKIIGVENIKNDSQLKKAIELLK